MQTINFYNTSNPSLETLAHFTNLTIPNFPYNFNGTSTLGKRHNPNMDAICEAELQKKLKIAFNPERYQPQPQILMHELEDLCKAEVERFECIKKFQVLLSCNMNQRAPQLSNANFACSNILNKATVDTSRVQEEVVKQEEISFLIKEETNYTVSDVAISEIFEGVELLEEPKEPILAEFTKMYPDWDLGTIFSYVQSGKTMDVFIKDNEFRAERKKRRAAFKRKIAAQKSAAANKSKINVKLE